MEGILRSSVNEMNKLSDAMEEVAIVDLDRNKFLSDTSDQDYGLLPSCYATPLIKAVNKACKSVKAKYSLKARLATRKKIRELNKEADGCSPQLDVVEAVKKEQYRMAPEEAHEFANAFIAFFVDLMGNYRRFIVFESSPHTGGPVMRFDKEGFLNTQPHEAKRVSSFPLTLISLLLIC